MEFLRFGSSIPGSYWGTCSCCIIQNFHTDPDQKASIQLVSGDGGGPLTHPSGGFMYAGPTYRDIFWQRIRTGTFDSRDMPNHAFLAILTQDQISDSVGKKWLAILREAGFEFIRTVCNSVYAGASMGKPNGKFGSGSNKNYFFGLFRNIGLGAIGNPFIPPKEWIDLPQTAPEAWEIAENTEGLTIAQSEAHRKIWDKIGPAKFLTEKDVVDAGAPIIYAGQRSEFPQESKEARDRKKGVKAKVGSLKEPVAV